MSNPEWITKVMEKGGDVEKSMQLLQEVNALQEIAAEREAKAAEREERKLDIELKLKELDLREKEFALSKKDLAENATIKPK